MSHCQRYEPDTILSPWGCKGDLAHEGAALDGMVTAAVQTAMGDVFCSPLLP